MRRMNVELYEFASLKALILLQNDLNGLSATSRENIKETREEILRSIFNQLFQRLKNSTEASLRLSNLLMILPSLFSIGNLISLNVTLGPLFGLCDSTILTNSLLLNDAKHLNLYYNSNITNETNNNTIQPFFKIPLSTSIVNSKPFFIDNNKKEISNFLSQYNKMPISLLPTDNKNETMISKEILLANILAANNNQKQENFIDTQNFKNVFNESFENIYQNSNNTNDNKNDFDFLQQSTSGEFEKEDKLNTNSSVSFNAFSAFSSIPSQALSSTTFSSANKLSKSNKSLLNLPNLNTIKLSNFSAASSITLDSLNSIITSVPLSQNLSTQPHTFHSLLNHEKQLIVNEIH